MITSTILKLYQIHISIVGEGFTALEQVGRLYDVNVMALISYDQVKQH